MASLPHGLGCRLMWKYVVVVVTLVVAAVVSVGSHRVLLRIPGQRARGDQGLETDKASAAAVSIQQFIEGIVGDLQTVSKASDQPARAGWTGQKEQLRGNLS